MIEQIIDEIDFLVVTLEVLHTHKSTIWFTWGIVLYGLATGLWSKRTEDGFEVLYWNDDEKTYIWASITKVPTFDICMVETPFLTDLYDQKKESIDGMQWYSETRLGMAMVAADNMDSFKVVEE